MNIFAVIIGILFGLGVAYLLWKPFFGDLDGFMECLRFWGTSDELSRIRGELSEDWMATAKIFLWLACVGGSAAAVRYGLILLFS